MSMSVIDKFEVVEITEYRDSTAVLTSRATQLMCQQLYNCSAIQQSCKCIVRSFVEHCFAYFYEIVFQLENAQPGVQTRL